MPFANELQSFPGFHPIWARQLRLLQLQQARKAARLQQTASRAYVAVPIPTLYTPLTVQTRLQFPPILLPGFPPVVFSSSFIYSPGVTQIFDHFASHPMPLCSVALSSQHHATLPPNRALPSTNIPTTIFYAHVRPSFRPAGSIRASQIPISHRLHFLGRRF